MNRRVTAISVGLNFVLLGVFLFCFNPSRFPPQPKLDSKILFSSAPAIVRVTNVTDATHGAATLAKFHWRDIESEDYPTYIANLRAVRCPEKTIFDILFADIEKLFADRKKKLDAPDKFWLTGDDLEKARLAKLDKLSDLEEERHALIKTLLHSDLNWEVMQFWHEEKELGLFVGFLPDAQAELALSVAARFGNRIETVEKRAGSLLIPEDAGEKKKLYSEMRIALGGIVSAAELEEGELRIICLISYLFSNSDLKDSKLTGPELRQIMQLKLRFDNPLERELGKYSGEDSVPEELAKQNFLEQAKKFLGEVRFQQFLRAHDEGFEQLYKLTETNGLRPQIAMAVYEIQQAALLESSRVREDRTLSRKEQRLELEAFEQSWSDAVQRLLGEKVAASYSTNGGGWLMSLGKP